MTFTQIQTLADQTRGDFPILDQKINDKPLIYFDNAATSQKPKAVMDALRKYYEFDNANVHRGAHSLSGRATDAYEGARDKVAEFINARSRNEIIYTRNASEAINLVAYSWGLKNLKKGDITFKGFLGCTGVESASTMENTIVINNKHTTMLNTSLILLKNLFFIFLFLPCQKQVRS
jgi:hypothetical protein